MKSLHLIAFLALLLISLVSCTSDVVSTETMWIGTDTNTASEGIYKAQFNPKSGELSSPVLVAEVNNPTYIDVLPSHVYSVSETDDAKILAFSKSEAGLSLLGGRSAYGRGACYVGVDLTQSFVAAANYGSGNGAVYSLDSDGNFGDSLFTFQHVGIGPNEKRQEGPHAHCSIFSPDSRILYVVNLGTDQVMAYPTSGDDLGNGFVALTLTPGDGPRHLIFHPNKPMAFIINELSNTIMSLDVMADGTFEVIDRKNTLPEDFTEHSQCSDIHLTADGAFLYGANRGHNSIVAFSVAENGELTLIGHTSVEGDWPRNFTLSPDENHLLVANQRSDNICVFERNKETGGLTFTGNQMTLSAPMCLKFE